MAAIDTREEVKIIIDRFINILKNEMNIDRVYLFGSYTNENFNENKQTVPGTLVRPYYK